MTHEARQYWDSVSDDYYRATRIRTDDFHYGPLLPGDRMVGLLPTTRQGMQCLEIGGGAGQNSIFLAGGGAQCTVIDISNRQLSHGMHLAAEHNVTIRFVHADIRSLPLRRRCSFDLVHSSFALPFVENPRDVLRAMAELVRPGGQLLFSTAHPLSNWEWLNVDTEVGIFVKDYFHPATDARTSEHDGNAASMPILISDLFTWLLETGLKVDAILEPMPLPIVDMSTEEIEREVPYWSEDWLEAYDELAKIPFTLIISASRAG